MSPILLTLEAEGKHHSPVHSRGRLCCDLSLLRETLDRVPGFISKDDPAPPAGGLVWRGGWLTGGGHRSDPHPQWPSPDLQRGVGCSPIAMACEHRPKYPFTPPGASECHRSHQLGTGGQAPPTDAFGWTPRALFLLFEFIDCIVNIRKVANKNQA